MDDLYGELQRVTNNVADKVVSEKEDAATKARKANEQIPISY